MNLPPASKTTSKTTSQLKSQPKSTPSLPVRGWRCSLAARLSILVIMIAASALALAVSLMHFFPNDASLIVGACLLLLIPIAIMLVRAQLRPVLELFRAMSGTVLSYQDRDFSFGLNWQRNDELADLVDAHNELGSVLREQRLDLVQR